MSKHLSLVATSIVGCLAFGPSAQAQNCSGSPVYFTGEISEVEGPLTVKAGKGCLFSIDGIPGALTETVISQKPKVGKAGVEGLKPYYLAKPGYQGPDESCTFTLVRVPCVPIPRAIPAPAPLSKAVTGACAKPAATGV